MDGDTGYDEVRLSTPRTEADGVGAGIAAIAADFRIAATRANIGASFTDLWALSSNMTYPTAAAAPTAVSSNVADAPTSTGAGRIRLLGWSESWSLVEDEFALNGTTPVSAAKKFWRVISARVTGTGSGKENAGDITVAIGGNAAALIAFTDNRSLQSHFTVPPGHEATLCNLRISAAIGGGQIDYGALRVLARFDGSGPFATIEEIGLNQWTVAGGGPSVTVRGPADLVLRVFAAGAGSNKRVAAGYDVKLRPAQREASLLLY